MKVLAAVVLIIGSASALGSGPYLPSGWRPDGPAFVLPARPPVVIPPQDFILHGSEASSSDFLREYGPPKLQSLPEVATEQSFVVLEAKFSEEENNKADAEVIEAATEAPVDFKYDAVEEISSVTESAVVEQATEIVQTSEQLNLEGRSNAEVEYAAEAEIEQKSEEEKVEKSDVAQVEKSEEELVKTSEVEKSAEELTQKSEVEAIEQVAVGQEHKVESSVNAEVQDDLAQDVNLVEKEVKKVEEVVKNIAEAIVSLDKEVVTEEAQLSQDLSQLKSGQPSSGLEQLPEGFLEYGPPGFREYGPPEQVILPRTADDIETEEKKIENNETRRRRFSPKFKSLKAKTH